jgi:hypothetical protein
MVYALPDALHLQPLQDGFNVGGEEVGLPFRQRHPSAVRKGGR